MGSIFVTSILLLLPGYVTLAAYPRVRGQPRDGLEALFEGTLSNILVVSLSGLLLAELGRFSLAGVLLLAAGYSGLVIVLRRPNLHPLALWRSLRWDRTHLIAAALLLISAVLFFRPFENIVGGRDGGVYVNTGIHIARTGSIHIPDDFFSEVPVAGQQKLTWVPPPSMFDPARLAQLSWNYRYKYPGFYWVADQGKLIPQGLPLYPIWVALFYTLFGLAGSLFVTPFFAWGSVAGLYLVGRSLFRAEVGLIAMALMIANASQIWFARYANADIFFQFVFIGGLFYWINFVRRRDGLSAALAGGCFGATLLAKIDALPLAVVLLLSIALFAALRGWTQVLSALALSFGVLAVWSLIQAALFAWPTYVYPGFYFTSPRLMIWAVLLFGTGLAVLVSTAVLRRMEWGQALLTQLSPRRKTVLMTFAGSFLVLGFSMLIPVDWAGLSSIIPNLGVRLDFVHQNLMKLSWYLTPLGIGLWMIGTALLATQRWSHETFPLLLSTVTYAAINLVFYNMGNQDHPWAIRRHISVLMPTAMLLIAYTAWQSRWLPLDRIRFWNRGFSRGIPVLLAAFLIVPSAAAAKPLIPHQEFQGAIAEVQRWGRFLPSGSVVVFDGSWLGNYLAPPLATLYDQETLSFWPAAEESPFDQASLEAIVAIGQARGRPVFFVSTHDTSPSAEAYTVHRVRSGHFQMPLLEYTTERLPRSVVPRDMPYQVYQLEPGPGKRAYEAEALSHQVGQVVDDVEGVWGQAVYAHPGTDQAGYLSYGPYELLPAGRYQVTFRLRGACSECNAGTVALDRVAPWTILDVAAQVGNTVLAQRALSSADLSGSDAYQVFSLDFANPVAQRLEFRVYFTGRAELWVDEIEVQVEDTG